MVCDAHMISGMLSVLHISALAKVCNWKSISFRSSKICWIILETRGVREGSSGGHQYLKLSRRVYKYTYCSPHVKSLKFHWCPQRSFRELHSSSLKKLSVGEYRGYLRSFSVHRRYKKMRKITACNQPAHLLSCSTESSKFMLFTPCLFRWKTRNRDLLPYFPGH